ncbi:MAG: topology modulation protein [Armatimonadetes bacterium]|nr:topology modulation protein [Armatimonadota bacterium]
MSTGNRIMVIGSPGSGKSTFARELASITGMPLVHLDKHFWNAGWVETPKDEFYAWQREIVKDEMWIIDGNYGGSMDIRLERADMVINFELSKIVCSLSWLKRLATHVGRNRVDMPKGCPEKLDWEFKKYIWDFPKTSGKRNRERLVRYSELNVVTFKNRRETNSFLNELRKDAGENAVPKEPLNCPK